MVKMKGDWREEIHWEGRGRGGSVRLGLVKLITFSSSIYRFYFKVKKMAYTCNDEFFKLM